MSNNKKIIIFVVIIVILLLILFWRPNKNTVEKSKSVTTIENFNNKNGSSASQATSSPFQSSRELNSYYNGSTDGVQNYLVDNMTCHPSCCGDQWPVPFDNLTSGEIEQCIANRGTPGPFVRTNYTCGNGINGVGCPCINKPAYKFLVNRGMNSHSIERVEPTFLIRNDIPDSQLSNEQNMTPYEQLQTKKSMFVDGRLLNDLQLQRQPQSLANVQSYGSNLSQNNKQTSALY